MPMSTTDSSATHLWNLPWDDLSAQSRLENPAKFTSPTSATPKPGNYLLYWMASQALWRVDPTEGKGLDATFAYDWSPRTSTATITVYLKGAL